ncbi:MAG: hypothetical protein HY812_19255 [Planctomycetes bacterium]|nr:hypothetical protein [Planctomycetota bacterium]
MSPPELPDANGNGPPATLVLTGADGAGFLVLPLAGGTYTIHLDRRHVRFVQVLKKALAQDASLPPETRGWRSAELLLMALRKYFEETFLEDLQTIHRYASDINAKARRVVRRRLKAGELPIETRRALGLRIWQRGIVIRSPLERQGEQNGEESAESER